MNELRDYFVTEFRGNFPQIEIDPRVNLEALTNQEENPFFVTLRIARVGETSSNGLHYDNEIVTAIQEQMVGRGGIMGHIRDEERDTSFPIEAADWVGALRENGTLWGKAYIPPGEVREYIRRLRARGGKLSTSIYGPYKEKEQLDNGRWKPIGLTLESLDLAPADRAALQLGGDFLITSQMTQQNKGDDMTKDELLAELTAKDVPTSLRDKIIQEFQDSSQQASQLAELNQQITDQKTLNETLQGQLKTLQAKEFETAVDSIVAEYVKLEAKSDAGKERIEALRRMFRSRLVSEIGDKQDKAKVKETAETLWASEFKVVAEAVRDAISGPAAIIPGNPNGVTKFEDTPEARAAARARVGL